MSGFGHCGRVCRRVVMDQLMTQYFPDANFTEGNRPLFAFAAYNAGPGNISRMRKLAAQRGLDPDKWFNHVELQKKLREQIQKGS